jgi:CubicO group peptidase (beta-lactamase class C family)
MSRFLILLALALPALAAEPPVTGKAVKGFEPVDEAAKEFQKRIDCRAITVAVLWKGEVVYSRGFGWLDEERKKPVPPDALMRIASVTKPITSAAVKTLIKAKKISPTTRVFEYLKLTAPAEDFDPRWKSVTVQHLLDHKGGWDREKSFDPMFKIKDVEKDLDLKGPAKPADVVRWMLGKPMQFDPGEREAYSNFGFCILGRVVEKAAGKPYFDYVRDAVLKPAGATDMKLGKNAEFDAREVWYPTKDTNVEVMDAHGGLIASAPAVCKFMNKYVLTGDVRIVQTGINTRFFGGLVGTTSMARQRTDGYSVAVLCNNRRVQWKEDNPELMRLMDEALDKVAKKR